MLLFVPEIEGRILKSNRSKMCFITWIKTYVKIGYVIRGILDAAKVFCFNCCEKGVHQYLQSIRATYLARFSLKAVIKQDTDCH